MAWPPAGSGPVDILVYFFALWLLLVVGPLVLWVAFYYLWLKKRWEPHFKAAEEAIRQRDMV